MHEDDSELLRKMRPDPATIENVEYADSRGINQYLDEKVSIDDLVQIFQS